MVPLASGKVLGMSRTPLPRGRSPRTGTRRAWAGPTPVELITDVMTGMVHGIELEPAERDAVIDFLDADALGRRAGVWQPPPSRTVAERLGCTVRTVERRRRARPAIGTFGAIIPFDPWRLTGRCGHPVHRSTWADGVEYCERCPQDGTNRGGQHE